MGTVHKELTLTLKLAAGRPGQPEMAELVSLGVPVTIIIDWRLAGPNVNFSREGCRDQQLPSQALELERPGSRSSLLHVLALAQGFSILTAP